MMAIDDTAIRIGKAHQISAPSDPQIVQLIDEMTYRVAQRRRFNGQPVSKQIFINCIMVAIAEEGPKTWDYLFDHGASILGPALMAGEPGIPSTASRPLRKRFRWFADGAIVESDESPTARPLPSVNLRRKKDDGGRRKGEG